MNKERYKYSPDIEKISAFDSFTSFESEIDVQKNLFKSTTQGYAIEIPKNQICEGVSTINMHYPAGGNYKVENSITMGEGSFMRLVIYHHSSENVRIKDLLSVNLSSRACLEVVVLTDTKSTILSQFCVEAHRDSKVSIMTLDVDNKCVIRDQYLNLNESGVECSLSGLYLTGGEEHVDNYIKINHASAHCTSNQLYKGVLAGKSEAAFTGHILVAQDAQQTAAYQQNHNILLSDTAKINSRPQLEIYADDVKCNHGATVGRLDPEAIYYMRQRGISIEAARRLQLTGFAEDVVRLDDFEDLQSIVHKKITQKLSSI